MRPREGGLQWGEKIWLRVTTACGALRAVFASLRALFSFLPIRSGVIQGSCLGPLLFLMFINDITDIFNDSAVCKLYANNVAPATVLNGKSGDNAILHEFTCYYSNIFLNLTQQMPMKGFVLRLRRSLPTNITIPVKHLCHQ